MAAAHLVPYLIPERMKKHINRAVRKIKPYINDFDAIACTGVSGVLIGSQLSTKLNKLLIIVRKAEEICHSDNKIETELFERNRRYIIVDDFVFSGKTKNKIINGITYYNRSWDCVGIFEVSSNRWYNDITPRSNIYEKKNS